MIITELTRDFYDKWNDENKIPKIIQNSFENILCSTIDKIVAEKDYVQKAIMISYLLDSLKNNFRILIPKRTTLLAFEYIANDFLNDKTFLVSGEVETMRKKCKEYIEMAKIIQSFY